MPPEPTPTNGAELPPEVRVPISEAEALRVEVSALHLKAATADVALAKEKLAHAETCLQFAQSQHNAALLTLQAAKGPDGYTLTGLEIEERLLLFTRAESSP